MPPEATLRAQLRRRALAKALADHFVQLEAQGRPILRERRPGHEAAAPMTRRAHDRGNGEMRWTTSYGWVCSSTAVAGPF
jgi:hypothetical protein